MDWNMSEEHCLLRLNAWHSPNFAGKVNWLLWINEEHQADWMDRLWAGRVELQDELVATPHAVLYDALQKTEAALTRSRTIPLF